MAQIPGSAPHYFYGPKDVPMAREADGAERDATAAEVYEHFPDPRRWPSGSVRTEDTEPRNR
jgi:hypothetical protein